MLALLRRGDVIAVADSRLLLVGLKRLLVSPMFDAVQPLFLVGVGRVEGETSLSRCFSLLPLLAEIGGQALYFFEVGRLLAKWMGNPREEMVGVVCFQDGG